MTIRLDCEHQAGTHGLTVEKDRTGPAHTVLAAYVRASQAKLVSQEIDQQQARLDIAGVFLPIDRQGDAGAGGHDQFACAAR
jgi:hypothetical protein